MVQLPKEIRDKISASIKVYYETPAGLAHRRKVSKAVKQYWKTHKVIIQVVKKEE